MYAMMEKIKYVHGEVGHLDNIYIYTHTLESTCAYPCTVDVALLQVALQINYGGAFFAKN